LCALLAKKRGPPALLFTMCMNITWLYALKQHLLTGFLTFLYLNIPQFPLLVRPGPVRHKAARIGRVRRALPHPQTEQTRPAQGRPGHRRPGPGQTGEFDLGRIDAAGDRPGPGQGAGRKDRRRYHDHTPPAATAWRQAGGAPQTASGKPRRTRAGADAGSTGTETQASPPARRTTQPLQPRGRLAAQPRAKREAAAGVANPATATKPPRARADWRTAKPDEPRRQAERETVATLGSMADSGLRGSRVPGRELLENRFFPPARPSP